MRSLLAFRWLRRPNHGVSLLVYAAMVAGGSAWLQHGGQAPPSVSLLRGGLDAAVLAATGMFLEGLMRGKGRRLSWAGAGAALLTLRMAGRAVESVWGEPLQPHDYWSAWDAVWTGAIPVWGEPLFLIAAAFTVTLACSLLGLVGLSHLPQWRWLEARGRSLAFVGLGPLLVLSLFRDYLVPPGSDLARALAPRARSNSHVDSTDSRVRWEELFRQGGSQLQALAERPSLSLRIERTPDILFVHLESLRADSFSPELFPQSYPLVSSCYSSPRHYSSGNSTSNAVFGVLTGLSPGYFEMARQGGVFPLPLRGLRELGYHTHVWFPNDTLEFDHLTTEVLGPQLTQHRARDERRDQADRTLLAKLLVRPRSGPPRFDYLVLDSAHYDYAYPPDFEKYVPAASLGASFDPFTGEGGTLSSEAPLPEATKVALRNRYRNSLLYLDTLVAELLAKELDPTQRETWVVVFGDHGEAFWDKSGPMGHRTQLSDAQTRTPLLLCGMPIQGSKYRVTSHEDIFPTVFELLGARAPRPFMSGKSLLGFSSSRDIAVLRMPVTRHGASSNYAVVRPGLRVHFRLEETPFITLEKDDSENVLPHSPDAGLLVTQALGAARLSSPVPPSDVE